MHTKQLLNKNYHYIWSDNWCLDGDKAWFISGTMNILFCLDRNTKETIWIDSIPLSNEDTFRQHPRCLKWKDMIICLPDMGSDIKCYHLLDKSWVSIPVINPLNVRICCSNAWFVQDRFYIVSIGLRQIIELNIETESIDNYYDLSINNDGIVSGSLIKDNCIYVVGVLPTVLYKFDCIEKKIEIYDISEIKDQIQTISYDGEKFWLSGKAKKIYIWYEEIGKIIFLDAFPENFGVWNFSGKYKNLLNSIDDTIERPLFHSSVVVGDYIWFIPFQTNKILYVNKNAFEINVFSLTEENYTEENVEKQFLNHKYLLEYVRDNRYIGLFSLKNRWVFEIDSRELTYEIFDYKLFDIEKIDERLIRKFWNQLDITLEQELLKLPFFIKAVKEEKNKNLYYKKNSIGKEIYYYIK